MKTILCFGDSNTWGYKAGAGERFPRSLRWTGVLQTMLGDRYGVIEEGLNGRTTVWDDPIEGYKNGEKYLMPCLDSHRPIDLVIIMLGTNDTKCRFSLSAYDIAAGMDKLVGLVVRSGSGPGGHAPRILVVSPAPIKNLTDFAEQFKGAEEKSALLKDYYLDIAHRHGCHFFDAGSVVQTDPTDGIHLDAAAHHELGKQLGMAIKGIFNR